MLGGFLHLESCRESRLSDSVDLRTKKLVLWRVQLELFQLDLV